VVSLFFVRFFRFSLNLLLFFCFQLRGSLSCLLKTVQMNEFHFFFENLKRNELLIGSGYKQPKTQKTGTTIVGLVFKGGVILGADTRATSGSLVCDSNCQKIHNISKLIYCCGAGTSADTDHVTGLISSQLELHRLETGQEPRVVTAMTRIKQHLFQYQGHVEAALILGGIDCTGSHLYAVYPHGSTDRLPYATMGSGSLAAMSEFEAAYKDDLSEEEAIELVTKAVQSGIWNDLGSGSNVDICVISREKGVNYTRSYRTPNERKYRRKKGYAFPRGTTEWLKEVKSRVEVMDVKPASVQ